MKTYFCEKCFDNNNKLLESTKQMQYRVIEKDGRDLKLL